MENSRLIRIDDPADPRIAEFVSVRERDLAGRGEQFIAEGTVVLSALLDASDHGHFSIAKLLLLENRTDGLGDLVSRLDPAVPVYVATGPVLDAIVGFAMHRGVLALGVRRPPADLPGFLGGMPDNGLLVACCGISNHDNMGSIFRNAGVFGADGVVLDKTSCNPLYRKSIRVSVGAALHVPFCQSGSVETMVTGIVEAGYDLIGLSPRGTIALQDYRPQARVALLLGTEGTGLPQAILDRVTTVRIGQAPGLDSLNVATATGIALWQVAGAMGRLPGN